MNFLVDFILLAIVVLFAVAGFKKGFVKTLISSAKKIVAFVVATTFSSRLGAWLKEQFFMEKAREIIKSKLSEFIGEKAATDIDLSNLLDSEHSGFLSFIEKMNVDTETLSNMLISQEGKVVDNISDYIAEPCVNAISSVIAFVILFFGTLLVLLVVGAILNLIAKLPVLKGTNKLLGGILGAAMGIFWAFVLTALIRIIVPYFSDNAVIASLANGGPLYNFISSLAPTFLSEIL